MVILKSVEGLREVRKQRKEGVLGKEMEDDMAEDTCDLEALESLTLGSSSSDSDSYSDSASESESC